MWTSSADDSEQSRRRRRPPEEAVRNGARDDHIHPQLRLKCIVLGSAGAGKTSLLRRFAHGTFEGHTSGRGDVGHHHHRIRRTRGADYYVKRVTNPLFVEGAIADSAASPPPARPAAESSRHALVQLWDTAGKESLKPRRHPAQYDAKSNFYQFLSVRPSSSSSPTTNNGSNYEHRYNNWGFPDGIAREERGGDGASGLGGADSGPIRSIGDGGGGEIARPGRNDAPRHRGPAELSRRNDTNEATGGALFRNIDACMLVYDATSSMSFLLLMELHSEWVQRLRTWEREDAEERARNTNNLAVTRHARRKKRIPFIVVANKLDLLEEDRTTTKTCASKRRSVMGLRDGEYKGKDFIYEYSVEDQSGDYHIDRLTFSLKETSWSNDETYLNALQRTEDRLAANRLLILLWCNRNGIPHAEASALDGRGVDEAMKHLITAGIEELRMREMDTLESRRVDAESVSDEETATSGGDDIINGGGIVSAGSNSSKLFDNNTEDIDVDSSTERSDADGVGNKLSDGVLGPVAVSAADPSQYYFLYQPQVDKDLDLFARYSTNDEQKCSCWLSLLAFCRQ